MARGYVEITLPSKLGSCRTYFSADCASNCPTRSRGEPSALSLSRPFSHPCLPMSGPPSWTQCDGPHREGGARIAPKTSPVDEIRTPHRLGEHRCIGDTQRLTELIRSGAAPSLPVGRRRVFCRGHVTPPQLLGIGAAAGPGTVGAQSLGNVGPFLLVPRYRIHTAHNEPTGAASVAEAPSGLNRPDTCPCRGEKIPVARIGRGSGIRRLCV